MRLSSVLVRILSVLALAGGCKRERPDVIALWPNGAPGSETLRAQPEEAKDWWVKNVHDPSLTVFRPTREESTGAAVIIMPGGGHERLVFGPEGIQPARFLAKHGIVAFVLKYRLAGEPGSPYTVEEHARADGLRAVRWVRHHARHYGVDPDRVGVMGWSAGGEIAAMLSYGPASGDASAADPIEKLSARPSFQIIIYPGSRGIPSELPPNAPPAFLLAAKDDAGPARTVARLADLYRRANHPAEVHLLPEGGHGFNMGKRSRFETVRKWPDALASWLRERKLSP